MHREKIPKNINMCAVRRLGCSGAETTWLDINGLRIDDAVLQPSITVDRMP